MFPSSRKFYKKQSRSALYRRHQRKIFKTRRNLGNERQFG